MNLTPRIQSSVALLLGLLLAGCGARTTAGEVGGKTSWLSACSRDADCALLEGAVCLQRLCTLACEDNSCGSIAGTSCVESGRFDCLTQSACVPDCKDDSDCRKFGEYTCEEAVCVADSCLRVEGNAATAEPVSTHSEPAPIPDSGTPVTAPPSPVPTLVSNPPVDETTGSDADSSGNIVCVAALDREPEQRPYKPLLEEWGYDPMLQGEPGCNGTCGYEYNYREDLWVLNPALQCPLDTSACEAQQAALDANPARCETAEDCTYYSGSLAPCEPFFDQPRYFDSALFTSEERAAREAILLAMQQQGCRNDMFGWDGPTYALGCVDNLCRLVWGERSCDGLPLQPECDACAPNLDAGSSE